MIVWYADYFVSSNEDELHFSLIMPTPYITSSMLPNIEFAAILVLRSLKILVTSFFVYFQQPFTHMHIEKNIFSCKFFLRHFLFSFKVERFAAEAVSFMCDNCNVIEEIALSF